MDSRGDRSESGNRLTSMTSAIAPNNGSQSIASQSQNVDFSSVLSRTLQSIKDDPAQLRNAIYELARIKLQRECFLTVPPLTVLETRRLMLALETAIERVEAVSSQQDELPTLESLTRLMENVDHASTSTGTRQLIVGPVIDHVPTPTRGSNARSAAFTQSLEGSAHRRRWSVVAPLFQAGALVTVLIALYIAFGFGKRLTASQSPNALPVSPAKPGVIASQTKLPDRQLPVASEEHRGSPRQKSRCQASMECTLSAPTTWLNWNHCREGCRTPESSSAHRLMGPVARSCPMEEFRLSSSVAI